MSEYQNQYIGADQTGEVVVEHMPASRRGSHREAGNWGRYPGNGAERVVMDRADAEAMVESDPDGYDAVIRTASPADHAEYRVVRDAAHYDRLGGAAR